MTGCRRQRVPPPADPRPPAAAARADPLRAHRQRRAAAADPPVHHLARRLGRRDPDPRPGVRRRRRDPARPLGRPAAAAARGLAGGVRRRGRGPARRARLGHLPTSPATRSAAGSPSSSPAAAAPAASPRSPRPAAGRRWSREEIVVGAKFLGLYAVAMLGHAARRARHPASPRCVRSCSRSSATTRGRVARERADNFVRAASHCPSFFPFIVSRAARRRRRSTSPASTSRCRCGWCCARRTCCSRPTRYGTPYAEAMPGCRRRRARRHRPHPDVRGPRPRRRDDPRARARPPGSPPGTPTPPDPLRWSRRSLCDRHETTPARRSRLLRLRVAARVSGRVSASRRSLRSPASRRLRRP